MVIGVHILEHERHTLPSLSDTYYSFTDVIKRAPPRVSPINSAFQDTVNKGVFQEGTRLPTDMNMHVDDNLMDNIQPFI